MAFHSDLLLDHVAWGFKSSRGYKTRAHELVSGVDRRNSIRSRPKHRVVAPYDRIKEAEFERVLAAFHIARGRADSFRFKDRVEYLLTDAVIGTAVGGADEEMQIVKPYTFGGITRTRVIKKPADASKYSKANGYKADAVAMAVTEDTGGGPVALAFSCDYETGILTFTSTAGAVIRVTCEFHHPMRFESDDLEFDYVEGRLHNASVVLVEDFAV